MGTNACLHRREACATASVRLAVVWVRGGRLAGRRGGGRRRGSNHDDLQTCAGACSVLDSLQTGRKSRGPRLCVAVTEAGSSSEHQGRSSASGARGVGCICRCHPTSAPDRVGKQRFAAFDATGTVYGPYGTPALACLALCHCARRGGDGRRHRQPSPFTATPPSPLPPSPLLHNTHTFPLSTLRLPLSLAPLPLCLSAAAQAAVVCRPGCKAPTASSLRKPLPATGRCIAGTAQQTLQQ